MRLPAGILLHRVALGGRVCVGDAIFDIIDSPVTRPMKSPLRTKRIARRM